MYAEVIFEPGSKSVLQFDTEDELKGFLQEQHRRALVGEDGGPAGNPSERISKVFVYRNHPADFAGNAVNSDKLESLVNGMKQEGGVVDGHQLISAIRDEMSPVYPVDQGRHESMYKATGTEYNLSFLNGGDDDDDA